MPSTSGLERMGLLHDVLIRSFSNDELRRAVMTHELLHVMSPVLVATSVSSREFVVCLLVAAARRGLTRELIQVLAEERPCLKEVIEAGACGRDFSSAADVERIMRLCQGPKLPTSVMNVAVVEIFSEKFPDSSHALVALKEANSLRLFIDPDAKIIRDIYLPRFEVVGAFSWWSDVLNHGRLHGPRMFACLLSTLDDLESDQMTVIQRIWRRLPVVV